MQMSQLVLFLDYTFPWTASYHSRRSKYYAAALENHSFMGTEEQVTTESRQQPTYISFLLTQSLVIWSCCLTIPLNIRLLMNLCLFSDCKTLMTEILEVTVIPHFSQFLQFARDHTRNLFWEQKTNSNSHAISLSDYSKLNIKINREK